LEGDRVSLSETTSREPTAEVATSETNDDPASRFGPLTPPPNPISSQPTDDASAQAADQPTGSSTDWLYDDP